MDIKNIMNFVQVLKVLRISSENWYLKIYNSTRLFKLPTSKARVPLKRFPGRSSISENVVISKICCSKIPSSTANANKLVGLYCKYRQIDKISCLRRNGSFLFWLRSLWLRCLLWNGAAALQIDCRIKWEFQICYSL